MTITARTTPEQLAAPCTSCGAAVAVDQRYCLDCGERSGPAALWAGPGPVTSSPRSRPPLAAGAFLTGPAGAMAAVGCLLLAMGVGVLIGRSTGHATTPVAVAPPAQVITVATAGPPGTSPVSTAAGFSDDWPAGKGGYTVELAKVATAAAVPAAKQAATAKGAKGVGALTADNYKGLGTGSFIVYSGVYPLQAQAQKALGRLKARFPKASVIAIRPTASGSSSTAPPATGQPAAVAAPAAIQQLQSATGQDYVKKSKALPNKVSTGGAPPKIDTSKPAGGGTGFSTIG